MIQFMVKVGDGVGWLVAHEILVSAPVPLYLNGFDLVWAGPRGFGD